MDASRTEVLSGLVKKKESSGTGLSVESYCLSGEGHANALVSAVADAYEVVTGRKGPTVDELRATAAARGKVSLLRSGRGTFGCCSVQVVSGTMFLGRSGTAALLPKGKRTNGYNVESGAEVLDWSDGYDPAELVARVGEVRARFPDLGPVTRADLEALPERAEDPAVCTLAVLGTYRMPDGDVPGALWLLHSYMREDGNDIAEGVLLIPPQSAGQGESEHGSIYGKQLLAMEAGKVLRPVSVTLADALGMCSGDGYARALAALRGA